MREVRQPPDCRPPASGERGWEQAPQVDDPDLEAVRELARELVFDTMHFHEIAIDDPFKAESWVQERGRRLLLLVGYPTGTRIYTPPEHDSAEATDV